MSDEAAEELTDVIIAQTMAINELNRTLKDVIKKLNNNQASFKVYKYVQEDK